MKSPSCKEIEAEIDRLTLHIRNSYQWGHHINFGAAKHRIRVLQLQYAAQQDREKKTVDTSRYMPDS